MLWIRFFIEIDGFMTLIIFTQIFHLENRQRIQHNLSSSYYKHSSLTHHCRQQHRVIIVYIELDVIRDEQKKKKKKKGEKNKALHLERQPENLDNMVLS